jgi:hypothetical protein
MYARLYFVTVPASVCHTSSLSVAPRLGRFNKIVSSTTFSPSGCPGAFFATLGF